MLIKKAEIPLNRIVLWGCVLLIGILTVIPSYFLWQKMRVGQASTALIMAGILWAGISIQYLFTQVLPLRLAKDGAGILLTQQGLINRTAGWQMGLIEWEDIMRATAHLDKHHILVFVENPEKYRSRLSFWQRLLFRVFKTPIRINTILLNASAAEINNVLKTAFAQTNPISISDDRP